MSSNVHLRPPQAEMLPNENTIYALVIGINNYLSEEYDNLKAAVTDADAIEEFLVNRLKALPKNIISLRDAAHRKGDQGEATRHGILKAFEDLEKMTEATADPCIIIFYAGHGAHIERPQGWEPYTTDRDLIELLCPSDMGSATADGRVVEGIPDRKICDLLNSLADKRGNNITLIMDCCHSAGLNRHDGKGKIVRCIPNPPPLTAEPNTGSPNKELQSTARAVRTASGFGGKFDRSHVLLAACGRDQHSIENKDGAPPHGIFTEALLKFLNNSRRRLDRETYVTLMKRLDMPDWQTPHCLGFNSDRPLFNPRGDRYDPSYLPCERKKEDSQEEGSQNLAFILSAGEAQGIELGQQFSIHKRAPLEGGNASVPSIGTMHVVSLEPHESRLEFLPGMGYPKNEVPRAFYARPLSWGKPDSSTIYCEDRQLLGTIFPPGAPGVEIKFAESPTQASLVLTVEGDDVHVYQNDPMLKEYISSRFPYSFKRSDTRTLEGIIRSWRFFNYHLNRRPTENAFPQVRMELHYLEPINPRRHSSEYRPKGGNLLAQEPATVDISISDDSPLGMALYNDGNEPVYPYLFYFDPNELTITPWVIPAIGAGPGNVDAPLQSTLTLGYGNGGAIPWEFYIPENRDKDVGFFKLFLSSSPVNFACLARTTSPFQDLNREDTRAQTEELTKTENEAAKVNAELSDGKLKWGVKTATVIQNKKK